MINGGPQDNRQDVQASSQPNEHMAQVNNGIRNSNGEQIDQQLLMLQMQMQMQLRLQQQLPTT